MAGGEILIIGKLVLTFGLLLGLSVWDLVKLRRELRSDEANRPGDLVKKSERAGVEASHQVTPRSPGSR